MRPSHSSRKTRARGQSLCFSPASSPRGHGRSHANQPRRFQRSDCRRKQCREVELGTGLQGERRVIHRTSRHRNDLLLGHLIHVTGEIRRDLGCRSSCQRLQVGKKGGIFLNGAEIIGKNKSEIAWSRSGWFEIRSERNFKKSCHDDLRPVGKSSISSAHDPPPVPAEGQGTTQVSG